MPTISVTLFKDNLYDRSEFIKKETKLINDTVAKLKQTTDENEKEKLKKKMQSSSDLGTLLHFPTFLLMDIKPPILRHNGQLKRNGQLKVKIKEYPDEFSDNSRDKIYFIDLKPYQQTDKNEKGKHILFGMYTRDNYNGYNDTERFLVDLESFGVVTDTDELAVFGLG